MEKEINMDEQGMVIEAHPDEKTVHMLPAGTILNLSGGELELVYPLLVRCTEERWRQFYEDKGGDFFAPPKENEKEESRRRKYVYPFNFFTKVSDVLGIHSRGMTSMAIQNSDGGCQVTIG